MTVEQLRLAALSPLDGRYHSKVDRLGDYFSEMALIKYRTVVELKWFIFLSQLDSFTALPALTADETAQLESLIESFSADDAARVKALEAECNHDVKSVEYLLREKFEGVLGKRIEFFHFACTSEDINNLSYALMVKDACEQSLVPQLKQVAAALKTHAEAHRDQPMLCRTHGQPATPSTLGKEFANFAYRLNQGIAALESIPHAAKINGATGNYNAHVVAAPEVDWLQASEDFISSLGLTFNPFTTQIEPHDGLSAHFDAIKRINTILLDLSQDCWQYISLDYLKLVTVAKEVGSSTMPHKVNPINFENAEGNFGVANALLSHMSEKLTRSRLQRDLSDSTVLRNIGVAYGYSQLAYSALLKGLKQITANGERMLADLNSHWEILAEPIQTVMRMHGIENAYEILKQFSRGQMINEQNIKELINSLPLDESAKAALHALKPETYVGLASRIVSEKL